MKDFIHVVYHTRGIFPYDEDWSKLTKICDSFGTDVCKALPAFKFEPTE